MAQHRLHALLLPFPAQGHINPMLHFASHLASRGCSVTFLHTQRAHKYILQAHPPLDPHHTPLNLDIRFIAIPDGIPPSFQLDTTQESVFQIMDGLRKQQGVLEELIESSRTDNNPISCIVSNCLCPWAQDLAKKAGLPGVLYWTCTATVLCFGYRTTLRQLTREDLERENLDTHNVRMASPQILSGFFKEESGEPNRLSMLVYESVKKASHILINSFETLEAFLEVTGPVASKMRYIGPCLPMEHLESKPSNDDTSVQKSLSIEDVECLTWLDTQTARSVLFISFGSIASFPLDQIKQIALGIEESKLKFLWVVRPDATADNPFPEGFIDRTKDRGRIIPWAQQLQVLQHPATGGFMTHCGWNSTLESIFMGVPMLCLPIFAEQPVNGALIVKQWQVGMALEKNEDGNVSKEEVERAARILMEGDEGRAMTERAGHLQKAARLALIDGGSSYEALTKFMQEVNETQKLNFEEFSPL